MTAVSWFPNSSNLRSRGVMRSRLLPLPPTLASVTPVWIFPISVSMPVRITTATPNPEVITVPAKTQPTRSCTGESGRTPTEPSSPGTFWTVQDSPVRDRDDGGGMRGDNDDDGRRRPPPPPQNASATAIDDGEAATTSATNATWGTCTPWGRTCSGRCTAPFTGASWMAEYGDPDTDDWENFLAKIEDGLSSGSVHHQHLARSGTSRPRSGREGRDGRVSRYHLPVGIGSLEQCERWR